MNPLSGRQHASKDKPLLLGDTRHPISLGSILGVESILYKEINLFYVTVKEVFLI